MKITLNNTPEEIQAPQLTVQQLLELKKFTFKLIIVKINDKVVPKHEYQNTQIHDGDNVVIFHLVSGG